MEEVLQAIPGEQVLRKLIDEFFLEARRSCEFTPSIEILSQTPRFTEILSMTADG